MVRRCFIFAAALALSPPAFAQDGPRAADELAQICQADAGALWGVSLCGPMLVAEPTTRALWANTADREGILRPAEGGWAAQAPEAMPLANTRLDWAGVRWLMLLSPLPSDPIERRALIIHEAWHRIQDELGLPAYEAANAHLASERGRALMRLEMRALATALRSSGVGQRRAVQDALLLRAARQAAFSQARGEEAALDRNEGLAAYTGVKLGAGAQALNTALRALDAHDRHEALARAAAYVTGPAYGLLLDQYRPRWRNELGLNAPADLLVVEFHAPEPTPSALASASARYGGAQVAAEERVRAEAAAIRTAALRAAYQGPRLELALSSPGLVFDPNRITPLEGFGAHYEALTLRDVWGELQAEAGALISGDFRSARAARPAADGLSGPGWRLSLSPGWALAGPDADGVWRVAPVRAEALPAPQ